LYISKLKAVVMWIHGLCSPYFFTAEKMYYLNTPPVLNNVSHFSSVDFLFLCVGEKLCMN